MTNYHMQTHMKDKNGKMVQEIRNAGTFVEIVVNGTSVKLRSDDRIAQHVLKGKPFEPQTLDFFHQQVTKLKHGGCFLDIGCYSGLFAIMATKLGMNSIGFEPFPMNKQQILWNMELNSTYFELSSFALSDKTGKARFGHTDVHLTSGGSLERKGSNGLEVDTMRLDDFYPLSKNGAIPERISLIKMDVERHEPSVIRGAKNLITRYKPVMIIETNDQEMLDQVNREMEGFGYAPAYQLDERNSIFTPS